MYSSFPIYFDQTAIPTPQTGWEELSNVIENTQQSEAGTDMIDVVRYDKLSITITTSGDSNLAKLYKFFSKQDSIQVKIYDVLDEAYKTRTMRMRNLTLSRRKNTDNLSTTNGIWDISCTLEEY